MENNKHGEIIIYNSKDGITNIEVKLLDETVWLSQLQMADLFHCSRSNIAEHIKNIYNENELDINSTCRKFRQVQKEGNRTISRDIPFYNLDMIISVGYRIKSSIATNFRKWATAHIREYIIKGFTLDDSRLKGYAGGPYWKELLSRIREIRSSEKVLYRQVLDLYATSVDYNPNSEESIEFFKIVQNKLHFAAHGHTAAEVIYERADFNKPYMGLTSFEGSYPSLKDIEIAKNYLNENELRVLNNLVSGYFDIAELNALEHKPMYMSDYIEQLDSILASSNRKILIGSGKISHRKAIEKAKKEYIKYQEITLDPVEEAYFKSITTINENIKNKNNK